MNLIGIAAPVLVGGLIGYCTNYIAIKMLFRPKKAVFLGKWKLLFTPGVIPKNQGRIATAVGQAVSSHLVTKDGIIRQMKEGRMKAEFVDFFAKEMQKEENTLETELGKLIGEEEQEQVFDALVELFYGKVTDGIRKLDIGEILKNVSQDSFSELLSNPMIAMFINESTIQMIAGKLGEGISDYLDEHGRQTIYPVVRDEAESARKQSLKTILESSGFSEEEVRQAAGHLFDRIAERIGGAVADSLSVSEMVEEKINEMDVSELEALVMSVMKQELQSVVNLGALIGALIGIINIFF